MWYRDSVVQKIKERSWKYEGVPGTYIDIVNVINATSVHWAADRMVRFPPIATNLFSYQNLTIKFFSAVFHWRPKRTPLEYTQNMRSMICSQLWWVLIEFDMLVRWDHSWPFWYFVVPVRLSYLTNELSKSDVCILLGWPSLALAITNTDFPCAGQPYKPVVLFKPWLPKVSWKSRPKVHLYVL